MRPGKKYKYRGGNYTARELRDIAGLGITPEAMSHRIKRHGVKQAMAKPAGNNAGARHTHRRRASEPDNDFGPFDRDLERKRQIQNWQAANMSIEEMKIKTRML